jgi:hypothetical protein
MPQRTDRARKSLTKLLFLSAALSLLGASVRRERKALLKAASARKRTIPLGRRRAAASLAFAMLFFAGAALSAGAGNSVVEFLPGGDPAVAGETTTTDTTAENGGPGIALSAGAPSEASASAQPQKAAPAVASAARLQPSSAQAAGASQPEPSSSAGGLPSAKIQTGLSQRAGSKLAGRGQQPGGARKGRPADKFHGALPVLASPKALSRKFDREPEADEPNVAATIWLHRSLPDPTPPERRLTPAFAHRLVRISARNHVDWALTLAVLRAGGERGAAPASKAKLQVLAKRLGSLKGDRSQWSVALAFGGQTTFADRAVALRNLYRAVGVKALVRGFEWAKPSLSKRILNDSRISIYPGGRADIEAGRVNIRILVLMAYLAEAHGQVTVSCLISGHRLYARPGVISAHIYGLAADISTLGGTSIYGHQQPGSVTEHAVRNILLLPAEMQPRQVISLIGMGGPSFPLANHDDHIHVGF